MLDTLRLAALRVAAMDKADQKWILSRLKREDALRLQPLVRELETLGLENFDDVYELATESLTNEKDTGVDSEQKTENLTTLERWSKARFTDVEAELRAINPALRAAIISAYAWPWLNEALQCFDLARAINPEKIQSNMAVVATLLAQYENQKKGTLG